MGVNADINVTKTYRMEKKNLKYSMCKASVIFSILEVL